MSDYTSFLALCFQQEIEKRLSLFLSNYSKLVMIEKIQKGTV